MSAEHERRTENLCGSAPSAPLRYLCVTSALPLRYLCVTEPDCRSFADRWSGSCQSFLVLDPAFVSYNGNPRMPMQIVRHLFTVADYTRMRETGILAEDDHVELVDGEVRVMRPIGPLHAAIVKRLNTILSREISGSIIISVQDPIQLNDTSEPQPDLALLHYRDDFYAQAHPVADDVLLVIEVADTTIDYDRDEKLPRYAEANIAEVWLIDVSHLRLEQYTQPRNGNYRVRQLLEQGDTIEAQAVAGLQFALNRVFK